MTDAIPRPQFESEISQLLTGDPTKEGLAAFELDFRSTESAAALLEKSAIAVSNMFSDQTEGNAKDKNCLLSDQGEQA